jgi:hypothetical protein
MSINLVVDGTDQHGNDAINHPVAITVSQARHPEYLVIMGRKPSVMNDTIPSARWRDLRPKKVGSRFVCYW